MISFSFPTLYKKGKAGTFCTNGKAHDFSSLGRASQAQESTPGLQAAHRLSLPCLLAAGRAQLLRGEGSHKALSLHRNSGSLQMLLGRSCPSLSASWQECPSLCCPWLLSNCLYYAIQLGSNIPKRGLRSRLGVMSQLEDIFQINGHFLKGK